MSFAIPICNLPHAGLRIDHDVTHVKEVRSVLLIATYSDSNPPAGQNGTAN